MNERLAKAIERYHARYAAMWALEGWHPPLAMRRWSEDNLNLVKPLHWDDKRKTAWISNPTRIGLRLIGHVVPEPGSGNRYFMRKYEMLKMGWHTDPDGWFSKDGDGLVWGVVYQLPATRGMARLVAGYQYGGDWGGTCVDFSHVWEECTHEASMQIEDTDSAYAAARAADTMADESAAEDREYRYEHQQREEGYEDESVQQHSHP